MWKNKPQVEEWSEFYYDAFATLTHSRPIGFGGPLPIPLAEIECFTRLYDIPQYERVAFVTVLRRIDMRYLDLVSSRKGSTISQPAQG